MCRTFLVEQLELVVVEFNRPTRSTSCWIFCRVDLAPSEEWAVVGDHEEFCVPQVVGVRSNARDQGEKLAIVSRPLLLRAAELL